MSAKRTCSIDGCESPHEARGWCKGHYVRWSRYGDPLWKPSKPTPVDRFWSYVDEHGPDGFHFRTGENLGPCWLWTGSCTGAGYSQLRVNGRMVRAHRFAYELLVGPIPEGLEPDHLCRVRHCVRPYHLEPVTHAENVLRGDGHPAKNAVKTHCLVGHPFSPENTYVNGRKRFCRACDAGRHRAAARADRARLGKVSHHRIGASQ